MSYVTPGSPWERVDFDSAPLSATARSLVRELKSLVAIPSVNPDHGAANAEYVGERRMAEALCAAFAAAGAS